MHLCCKVLDTLQGKTLVSAESCTGGMIGEQLTAIPGSSSVYKGGIISYTNWVKENFLGVDSRLLETHGAVSSPVAKAMASGARKNLQADVSVSVTGLAGPGGDERGNPVGTVFIGVENADESVVREFHFSGDREAVRCQAARTALEMILELHKKDAP